jgi:hypothetical protein
MNKRRRWIFPGRERLTEMIRAGSTIEDIAIGLDRAPSAIEKQLVVMKRYRSLEER